MTKRVLMCLHSVVYEWMQMKNSIYADDEFTVRKMVSHKKDRFKISIQTQDQARATFIIPKDRIPQHLLETLHKAKQKKTIKKNPRKAA